jgi:hypothetical protein
MCTEVKKVKLKYLKLVIILRIVGSLCNLNRYIYIIKGESGITRNAMKVFKLSRSLLFNKPIQTFVVDEN